MRDVAMMKISES